MTTAWGMIFTWEKGNIHEKENNVTSCFCAYDDGRSDSGFPVYYLCGKDSARKRKYRRAIMGITISLGITSSLKKKMTDAEFQAVYNEALKSVQTLVGLSPEEQMKGIYSALRTMADNGTVSYRRRFHIIMTFTAISFTMRRSAQALREPSVCAPKTVPYAHPVF